MDRRDEEISNINISSRYESYLATRGRGEIEANIQDNRWRWRRCYVLSHFLQKSIFENNEAEADDVSKISSFRRKNNGTGERV